MRWYSRGPASLDKYTADGVEVASMMELSRHNSCRSAARLQQLVFHSLTGLVYLEK